MPDVRLVEITRASLGAVLRLAVAPDQARFVAPNAVSIAEAHFEPAAWFRAVALGDTPVGFAQLYDPTLPGVTEPDPDLAPGALMLWRLMIDAGHQGRGYGRAAVALVAAHARARGASRLAVTYVPAAEGPEGFYGGLGFVPTGRLVDGEAEALLALDAGA